MQIAGIHAIALTLPRFVDQYIESEWVRIRLFSQRRNTWEVNGGQVERRIQKLCLLWVIYYLDSMRQICSVEERMGKSVKLFEIRPFKKDPAFFFATQVNSAIVDFQVNIWCYRNQWNGERASMFRQVPINYYYSYKHTNSSAQNL